MAIIKPETLGLNLCPWIEFHKERGDTHIIKLGDSQGVPTLLQFNEYSFMNPSCGFVMEFTRYFRDRVLLVSEDTCPACRAELERHINTEIVEAHGVPPKEER